MGCNLRRNFGNLRGNFIISYKISRQTMSPVSLILTAGRRPSTMISTEKIVTDVAYCIPMTTLLFSTKRNNDDDDDGKRMKSNNNIVKFRFNIIICNMQSKSTSSLICNMQSKSTSSRAPLP